jgi:hypothetical protein
MKHLDKYLFLAIVILLSILFHKDEINEFPSFVHAWSQSDHYALAIGFLRNHFDFFHPETYVLNPQFPGGFQQINETGITAADFPVHHFIAALIMKISGGVQPWCFRLYILIYSFAGLFFLYKLSLLMTDNKGLSLFAVIFTATSPVFVYYQAGFLPSIPSLANLFIALYFYFEYRKSGILKHFVISIIFLTLAALSRTPFVIFLIAISSQEILYYLKIRKINILKGSTLILSFFVIGAYFIYNSYLRNKYGSIFLSRPLPPDSFQNFILELKQVFKNWKLQYFSFAQYIFIFIILLYKLYRKLFQKQKTTKEETVLITFTGISFTGVFLYFVLMIKQFPAHDYYFLDTFFPVFVLWIIWLLTGFPNIKRKFNLLFYLILLIFSIGFVKGSAKVQNQRRQTGDWDRVQTTQNNFTDSQKLLDSLGVSKDAKVLVIDAYAPNIPFILMNRKGYTVLTTSVKNIRTALNWDYDFIAIQDIFLFPEVVHSYPEIINIINKAGGNGKISIYKKLIKPREKTDIHDFLHLDMEKALIIKNISFDSIPEKCWKNTLAKFDEGKNSLTGYITPDERFGLTLTFDSITGLKPQLLFFEGEFFNKGETNQFFVVVTQKSENANYYRATGIHHLLVHKGSWQHIYLLFSPLPEINLSESELSIYFWNPGSNDLLYDNISVSLF